MSQLAEGVQVDGPRGLEHLPVALEGERAYANALSACQAWFDLPEALQSDNARLRTLEVVLPLPQGHVRRLEQDVHGRLLVMLVPGLDNGRIKVRIAWDEHGAPYELSVEANSDGALFDLVPPGAFTVYVFNGGQLLTHYHGDGRRILHPDLTLETEIRVVVLDGESESSEFKELSGKGRDCIRSLSDKILRTVCGMANTNGGYFLLGVSDDSKVLGLDQSLAGFPGKTEPARKEALVRELKKLLRARLPDAPQVAYSWVHLDGKTILVLDIHRCTPGHPCSIDGRQMLVRRGSSTRPPLPEELRGLLSGSFG